MTKDKWKQIQAAKEILGLDDKVTRADLKKIYRRLSKKFHPDTAEKEDARQKGAHFLDIAKAYTIIMEYCDHYPVPLSPDEESSMSAEEWWMDRFGQDPLWGKKKTEN